MSSRNLTLSTTADGSLTVYSRLSGEHYHSMFGAITESRRVFMELGLCNRLEEADGVITVLEAGFGTGLNALLSLSEAIRAKKAVHYYTYELYPLEPAIYERIHFPVTELDGADEWLLQMHEAAWGCDIKLHPLFTLTKRQEDLTQTELPQAVDTVYWDAFSPEAQPELWSEELFRKVFECCNEGALLTTYCAKGEIRRRLQRAGFDVLRMPGPKGGKREVLQAIRREPHTGHF
ncbi:tRNA (5-methylaminomethyl-2-thiouridine)(34)-methyltransferase MnmD [Porphyromonas macacae]|uniref:tRNA 5-methylaminomethyl-2-thiouridine biosynthesis bifunctional protein MnmC n=1 Tax=Porphyromonas macacae TaxID=28115 RepID=A0A379DGH5_9PORP|nr:tRNA (5-methylaminomethyl-2-thiouridine)(34)-methyltransferase MnmD [Porphyromonas macacae]SUB77242.1 tRNA 5-methylaminomethyl-2-thiouridine biosynthesis bifunctional protein MnmC [Porphyromonas macacae]